MDARVEALDLTEVQKEQYAAVREKVRSDLIEGREARRRLLANVRQEMSKELPDLHEVAGMISEHLRDLPLALDRGMSRFLEFYEVLDDRQKAEVVRHFRDRLNRIPLKPRTGAGVVEEGADPGFMSLSEQKAQKRGDRSGELL
jgi:Spy/CpxP family protein refolding chaperone